MCCECWPARGDAAGVGAVATALAPRSHARALSLRVEQHHPLRPLLCATQWLDQLAKAPLQLSQHLLAPPAVSIYVPVSGPGDHHPGIPVRRSYIDRALLATFLASANLRSRERTAQADSAANRWSDAVTTARGARTTPFQCSPIDVKRDGRLYDRVGEADDFHF